jgi:ferredoxin
VAKTPVIDLSECSECEGCLAVCPEVFHRNEAGYIEVVEADSYPEDGVQEAMNCCPASCITWEES